jgi:hypothetical protein
MSIFGQVWLWSALAFVVGVLLTWLVLVRPAQARNRVLERRLLAAQTAPAPERQPVPDRRPAADRQPPLPTRTFDREPEPQPATEHIRPQFEPEVKPAPEPAWYDRESFGEPLTEHGGLPESTSPPESDAERTSIFSPYVKPEPERGSLFDPSNSEPEPNYESFEEEAPAAHAYDEEPEPAVEEAPVESTQLLPRRQPRNSPRGGFDAPQPIQPSMRSIERREPVQSDEGGRSGSLFEPAVRPSSGGAHAAAPEPAPAPPPARGHSTDASIASGPFGPGSAMPLPGGGRPADDFEVKASVTALRYCTEESPQFPRMVAEVWFRTAADAERVGFRPLT